MATRNVISSIVASGPGAAAFAGCVAAGAVAATIFGNPVPPMIVALAAGLYCLLSIKVVRQWEKVAVLRLGRYIGLRGPGMFWIIPVIDTLTAYVDQRIRATSVSAESTLTRDTVPTSVDAIVFWLVWNAEKSLLEVADFADAMAMSAQTALRESIGRPDLPRVISG